MDNQERPKRKVTIIEANPEKSLSEAEFIKKHLRVAPYCRVSTDNEEQLSSYKTQMEYYTQKINNNPDWSMVDMYADEGITGTSTWKRKDFLRMIKDCEKNKIDLIITKSVSRFARNTLDGLDYVRRLKQIGVGVYFEKENVNTLYMDSELILTFMMSQAQAESESISTNVKWGVRKRYQDGKVRYQYKNLLGYCKGIDGEPEIDPPQAKVVQRIFSRYLLGHSVARIARDLEADHIETLRGNTLWRDGVIRSILQNEKYIGDAILQKTYVADLFTKKIKKNTGELPQYYVHNSHPAIIERETFYKVQEEMARRASLRKVSSHGKTQLSKYSSKFILNELLVCGECGSPYRRVTWTQNGKKRIVWRCISRLENGKKYCKKSPTLDEPVIHAAIIAAMQERLDLRNVKESVSKIIPFALSIDKREMPLVAVENEIRKIQDRQTELFQLAVAAGPECLDYDEEFRKININKTRLLAKKAELEKEQSSLGQEEFGQRLETISQEIGKANSSISIPGFDEITVRQLISKITSIDKNSIRVRFKDGIEIDQPIGKDLLP